MDIGFVKFEIFGRGDVPIGIAPFGPVVIASAGEGAPLRFCPEVSVVLGKLAFGLLIGPLGVDGAPGPSRVWRDPIIGGGIIEIAAAGGILPNALVAGGCDIGVEN